MRNENIIRPGMRSWLMALAFIAVLPVLGFAIYALVKLNQHDEQFLLQELKDRTQGVQSELHGQINAAVMALNVMAKSDAALHGDYTTLYNYAKRVLAKHPEYLAVTLVNAQGHMVFHTSIPYGQKTFPVLQVDLIEQALRTGQPNVSGPLIAPISPKPVVAITVPLTVNGKTDQCLRIIISVDHLRTTLTNYPLPAGWMAGIVDKKWIIIARTHQPEKFEGKIASESFRSIMHRKDAGFLPSTTSEGVSVMNSISQVHNGDWVVGLGVPTEILYASRFELMQKMGILALAWLTVSFFSAHLLANYLVAQTQSAAGSLVGMDDHPSALSPIRVAEIWQIFHHIKNAKRDIKVAQTRLQKVTHHRDLVQDLYDQAPCGYHSLDKNGCIVEINQTELDMLGISRQEAIGQHFTHFLTEAGKATFATNFPILIASGQIKDLEFDLVRKDGSTMPAVLSATAIKDENGNFLMSRSTVFDMTERRAIEQELKRIASTDMLTNLLNRREFYQYAEKAIADSNTDHQPFSLIMLDADQFKKINDQYGHVSGDLVLKQLGVVCRATLRDTDIAARLGGEEFGILLPNTSQAQAADIAENLRLALAAAVVEQSNGPAIAFTVSMGVAQWRSDDANVDGLLKRADAALYQAKAAGRNRVVCG